MLPLTLPKPKHPTLSRNPTRKKRETTIKGNLWTVKQAPILHLLPAKHQSAPPAADARPRPCYTLIHLQLFHLQVYLVVLLVADSVSTCGIRRLRYFRCIKKIAPPHPFVRNRHTCYYIRTWHNLRGNIVIGTKYGW